MYSSTPKPIKKIILLLLKIVQKLISDVIFHVELPFKTRIGKGLRINHPYGIVINEYAELGDNCTIFHQVTIGMNEHSRDNQNSVPRLGNNVYIGCGAKIIGGITVGSNVVIGANTVVTKSIPDDCVVVGNPAYIVKQNGKKVEREII